MSIQSLDFGFLKFLFIFVMWGLTSFLRWEGYSCLLDLDVGQSVIKFVFLFEKKVERFKDVENHKYTTQWINQTSKEKGQKNGHLPKNFTMKAFNAYNFIKFSRLKSCFWRFCQAWIWIFETIQDVKSRISGLMAVLWPKKARSPQYKRAKAKSLLWQIWVF